MVVVKEWLEAIRNVMSLFKMLNREKVKHATNLFKVDTKSDVEFDHRNSLSGKYGMG